MAGAFLANHVYHRRSPGVWGQYVGHWEMNWCNLLIVGVSGINLKSSNLFPSSSSVWLFACAKRSDNAEIALAKQMARFGSIYPYQQCCSCSELDNYGFGMSIVEKDFGVFRCLPRYQIEAKEVEKTFGIFKFPCQNFSPTTLDGLPYTLIWPVMFIHSILDDHPTLPGHRINI